MKRRNEQELFQAALDMAVARLLDGVTALVAHNPEQDIYGYAIKVTLGPVGVEGSVSIALDKPGV